MEEFVEFVLGEVLSEEEESAQLSEEEKREVEERLKALGYI